MPYIRHGNARRVQVTAVVPGGWSFGHDLCPAPLDGMLAHVGRRVRRGVKPGQRDRHTEGMPLARIRPRQVTGLNGRAWVWLASCAAVDQVAEEAFWRAGSVDQNYDRSTTGRERRINISGGPDGSMWRAETITVGTVQWRAVGDPALIGRWLAHLPGLGVGSNRGHGDVARWIVDDAGPVTNALDDLRWIIEFGRPVPAAWGAALGVSGRSYGSYRPPYIHPARTSVGRMHEVEVAHR